MKDKHRQFHENSEAKKHVPRAEVMEFLPDEKALTEWDTAPETEEEVLLRLRQNPFLSDSYYGLNNEWRKRFLDFCQGKASLPLTYDPFFKRIFHPDIHPDRLSRLISSFLGIKVRVVRILPSEDSILNGGTLLIMDLLGELEDGSLINVEIQRQGYAFPAERISCYSADLVMRQYARVKGIKGRSFTYRDIKKVYVIVIFEKSMAVFHDITDACIHYGKTVFDTGLRIELLQEYCLIALDVFRKLPYTKDRNKQTAWLSLLTTESLADAERLIQDYQDCPWLEEIYQEIAMLRRKPEEVLGMFSEALRILDQNTVKYMVEELQKDLDEKRVLLDAQSALLDEKDSLLNEKDSLLNEKDLNAKKQEELIYQLQEEIAALKQQQGN